MSYLSLHKCNEIQFAASILDAIKENQLNKKYQNKAKYQ